MTTKNKGNGRVGQILPIHPGEVLTLEFSIKDHTYIKVVATSDTKVGDYAPNTEYWRTRDLADFSGFDRGAALSMKVGSRKWEKENIHTFFNDFKAEIRWPEAMPSWRWQRFSYTAPQIITPYLFSTPDHDVTDRQAPLGMSLLIDRNNNLQGVGWHKTFCPPTGYIWTKETAEKLEQEGLSNFSFSLDGWTTDPWTVHSGSGYPIDSWWYAINYIIPR